MKTSGTNRRIGSLIKAINDGSLIPRPEFQRRLVWSNRHKSAFIETVLKGFPFPEIYIAAGALDAETGERTELLVDGQQRLSTLLEYFKNSDALRLEAHVPRYRDLEEKEQIEFLDYQVVIRDLGFLSQVEIREIFRRINSTNYSLNAMEISNARYDGPLKKCAEELAQHNFFEKYSVFRANEIRRMGDVRFVLSYIITIMSSYFNRDDELETYLEHYNDEFEQEREIRDEVEHTLDFLDRCNLGNLPRALGKAALFTSLVEVHKALRQEKLDPTIVGSRLRDFYSLVDRVADSEESDNEIYDYYIATRQASNDRSSRIIRGEIIAKAIHGKYDGIEI